MDTHRGNELRVLQTHGRRQMQDRKDREELEAADEAGHRSANGTTGPTPRHDHPPLLETSHVGRQSTPTRMAPVNWLRE